MVSVTTDCPRMETEGFSTSVALLELALLRGFAGLPAVDYTHGWYTEPFEVSLTVFQSHRERRRAYPTERCTATRSSRARRSRDE